MIPTRLLIALLAPTLSLAIGCAASTTDSPPNVSQSSSSAPASEANTAPSAEKDVSLAADASANPAVTTTVVSTTAQKPALEQAATKAEPAPATPALEVPQPDGLNGLTTEQLANGWIRLFDGHTTFGWRATSDADWSIKDGVISVTSGKGGFLQTTTRFANYELLCDFFIEEATNSGIFLRSADSPKNPAIDCYELNFCDQHPAGYVNGSLVGRQKPQKDIPCAGKWHTTHATLNGPNVTVKVDGELVTEYTDNTANPLTTGVIGLQFREGPVKFRNIFLRPLGTEPLFDGKTLDGWQVVPTSEGTAAVDAGTIHLLGGRGFLETKRTAKDFILQFECKTAAASLNSGVFFRAMPGSKEHPSDGYEFQIHNGFKNNDRNQPMDHGTGAIFRRVNARRVVASDLQWLYATLVADGPHFSCWVDGFQVTDWIDTRKPNENPRQGLRLEAGHLSLQGHDPTTDLRFQNLRLADTP